MSACIQALKVAIAAFKVARELVGPITFELQGDNMAMIQSILYTVTSWRSRHYAVRAAWTRDTVASRNIKLYHVAGDELVADPLTKILSAPELPRARAKLGMTDKNMLNASTGLGHLGTTVEVSPGGKGMRESSGK